MNLPEKFLQEMRTIVPLYDDFLRSYGSEPIKAFKANAKYEKRLLNAIGTREKVPFADHCYYLNEKMGSHPFHHAGLLYIQEPSAMLPVNAFDIKASLAIDLCAAPGGKSIQLADKVDCLVSNEISPNRASVLKSNIERLGLRNVAITNHSPKELEKLGEIFDLVLVDAPCSGEGMFRKDEIAIRDWSEENSISCAARQYAILESADKLLKRGGMIIYSTCTFSQRENEDVILRFLNEHDYRLAEPNEQAKKHSISLINDNMRRVYPHLERGEGQFFAGLIKQSGNLKLLPRENKYSFDKDVLTFLKDTTGVKNFCEYGDSYFIPALPFELPLWRVVSCGVKIGKKRGKVFKPDHAFFSTFGAEMFCISPSEEETLRYLHGEELTGLHNGYGAVTVLGAPLGGFKGSDGRYKNLYPKGLRI